MTSVTLPQLGPAAPYARLKAAWDNRATYRDAVKAWRRISSSAGEAGAKHPLERTRNALHADKA